VTPGARSPDRNGAEDPRPNGVYISQVARILGVSASVVRGWESEGLIAPSRTPSGYRVFSVHDVERLRRIRDLMQGEGLNAAGVRRVLEANGSRAREPHDVQPAPHPGDRIQMLRKRRGVSLRALASMTGLSASSISAVERGLSAPSVGTLQRLAAALDVTVPKLLGTPQGQHNMVVRPRERPVIAMETPGVRFENLYAVETVLQSMLITVEPGHGSQESYSHEGEEFLFVVEGQFELTLDELYTHRLEAGDAMTFPSSRPHRWCNPGTVTTVTVWVNTPPTF
jgi:DNA-binding transcriptional MerR regulator/quercetin dioxygenase-like cupin family protein